MATSFKVNDAIHIDCIYKKTRNGFYHKATMYENGREICMARQSYLNRTWERYDYETVLRTVLQKSKRFKDDEIKQLLDAWSNVPQLNGMAGLNTIAMVMKMGEVLTDGSKKESNDWKLRMLKAGLPEGALSMPADWDTLPEEEKERRLNLIIEEFKG